MVRHHLQFPFRHASGPVIISNIALQCELKYQHSRVIAHFLYTHVFTKTAMSRLLQIVEAALFPAPGGYPASSVPDPTLEEQAEIKERAYRAVENAIPS